MCIKKIGNKSIDRSGAALSSKGDRNSIKSFSATLKETRCALRPVVKAPTPLPNKVSAGEKLTKIDKNKESKGRELERIAQALKEDRATIKALDEFMCKCDVKLNNSKKKLAELNKALEKTRTVHLAEGFEKSVQIRRNIKNLEDNIKNIEGNMKRENGNLKAILDRVIPAWLKLEQRFTLEELSGVGINIDFKALKELTPEGENNSA
ncbi:hypothetical protein [Microbulbifer sp. JMSA003]|uniref:hypothetical protein n=1 Tax=unclassified Microbulbifer TaxID=2619833 RepID=UPI00403A3176